MKYEPEIRYVDMCKYIDENAYKENHNTEKIFFYLTEIFHALAKKRNYFKTKEEYDDYSTYGAIRTYKRLTDKKQFLPENNPKRLPKIKSVLNYIKSILSGCKVSMYKANFQKNYNKEIDGIEISETIEKMLVRNLQSTKSDFIRIDVEFYIEHLPKTIQQLINTTYYSNDSILNKNIYMSCLLTLIDNLTLSNEELFKLNKKIEDGEYVKIMTNLYNSKKREENVLLWHLDEKFKDTISLLCGRIKKIISYNLFDILDYYEDSEEVVKNILMSPVKEAMENEN